jgi:hypothetical protein
VKRFLKGNIVRFGNSFWIVAEEKKHEKLGVYYDLLSMSSCNCGSGIYENPSHQDWHIDKAEWVADCVYDFIEKGMLRFLDDLGKGKTK